MNADLFFQREPHLLPLYHALESRILSHCGDFSIAVRKTQISLSNRHLFACVSLPPARKTKPADHIILTLCLNYRIDSPRIAHASEPYPNRWTHHLPLRCEDDIDAELLDWLTAAYAFAQHK